MLCPGRGQSDRLHSRRRRGRPVERAARTCKRQPARRPLRAAQDPQRRARHVAARDLVQRSAGALRAGRGRRPGRRLRGAVPARALPLRRAGPRHRRRQAGRHRRALRQPAHRHAAVRAAGQAAQDGSRRHAHQGRAAAVLHRGDRAARGRHARAASARRRGQDLPRHHRRPHGHGADLARPDGRSLAGSGGRRRADRNQLRHVRRRGHGHG